MVNCKVVKYACSKLVSLSGKQLHCLFQVCILASYPGSFSVGERRKSLVHTAFHVHLITREFNSSSILL